MLRIFRKKHVARMILWAILILILPAFVIWGAGGMGRSRDKGPTYAGLIDKKKVSFDDFAESITAIKAEVLLNFFNQPKVLDSFLKNKPFLGKLAWDRLIMSKEARKYRIKVTDAEVVKSIETHPIFSRSGKFDSGIYKYVLRNNMGIDPRTFEEIIREDTAIKKMHELLTKDITASPAEILGAYKVNNEKFKISYVIFEKSLGAEYAKGEYKKIMDLTSGGANFEDACSKLGLKAQETPVFAKSDYLEGIGEAVEVIGTAVKLKVGDVSAPVETRKGFLVFRVVDVQGYDEENFKKEKEEYSKRILEFKSNKFLENWLRDLESKNTLNIDLKDYEKYYS